METLRFFVPSNRYNKNGTPAPLDGLNELINAERGDWRIGNRLKRKNGKNAESACAAAMKEQGWRCPKGRCLVTLKFVEVNRRRDPDNIYGGAKFILDGITKRSGRRTYGAGAIVDDSQKWVKLRYDEDISVDKERPGCWVTIETMGEE